MGKLIQEASVDDSFNRQMMKIQDAIEALEALEPKMDSPVASQGRMLEVSAEDLKKLAAKLQDKRSAKGLK